MTDVTSQECPIDLALLLVALIYGNTERLFEELGKTIKEWAEADLPYGAFEEMVREIDPVYGIFAPAGAHLKTYIAECDEFEMAEDADHEDYEEIPAYHKEHACRIAVHDLKMPPSVSVRLKAGQP